MIYLSIKRSIVIGEPKVASTSKDTKKKSTKKESTTIKRKVTKEALTPMGIVRDKSVLQTSVPPEQREPRVYNPDHFAEKYDAVYANEADNATGGK